VSARFAETNDFPSPGPGLEIVSETDGAALDLDLVAKLSQRERVASLLVDGQRICSRTQIGGDVERTKHRAVGGVPRRHEQTHVGRYRLKDRVTGEELPPGRFGQQLLGTDRPLGVRTLRDPDLRPNRIERLDELRRYRRGDCTQQHNDHH
jgi:hypothetical protein